MDHVAETSNVTNQHIALILLEEKAIVKTLHLNKIEKSKSFIHYIFSI